MPDECHGCYFVRQHIDANLYCHFGAPQQHWRISGKEAWWPQVDAHYWCGNFRDQDPNLLYIQGQGQANTTAPQLLLASTNPDYPVVSLRSLQITNMGNKNVLVGLHDGGGVGAEAIGFCGAASLAVENYQYDPGILTSPGNDLYFGIDTGSGPVYVAAQGRMLPPPARAMPALKGGDYGPSVHE